MQKKVALKLIDHRPFREGPKYAGTEKHFRVESISNSIEFVAGDFLSETAVAEIITRENHDVSIRLFRNSDDL